MHGFCFYKLFPIGCIGLITSYPMMPYGVMHGVPISYMEFTTRHYVLVCVFCLFLLFLMGGNELTLNVANEWKWKGLSVTMYLSLTLVPV